MLIGIHRRGFWLLYGQAYGSIGSNLALEQVDVLLRRRSLANSNVDLVFAGTGLLYRQVSVFCICRARPWVTQGLENSKFVMFDTFDQPLVHPSVVQGSKMESIFLQDFKQPLFTGRCNTLEWWHPTKQNDYPLLRPAPATSRLHSLHCSNSWYTPSVLFDSLWKGSMVHWLYTLS